MLRHRLIRWLPLAVLGLALAGCNRKPAAPEAGQKPHSAALRWNASTSRVQGYHIYRTTDTNAQPGLLAVTPANVTQYEDKTVEAGRTYYYSVKSVGPDGIEGDFSVKISATIPAN